MPLTLLESVAEGGNHLLLARERPRTGHPCSVLPPLCLPSCPYPAGGRGGGAGRDSGRHRASVSCADPLPPLLPSPHYRWETGPREGERFAPGHTACGAGTAGPHGDAEPLASSPPAPPHLCMFPPAVNEDPTLPASTAPVPVCPSTTAVLLAARGRLVVRVCASLMTNDAGRTRHGASRDQAGRTRSGGRLGQGCGRWVALRSLLPHAETALKLMSLPLTWWEGGTWRRPGAA